MPLSDIAISQPCSCLGAGKIGFRSEIGVGLHNRFSWKTFYIPGKVSRHHDRVWQGRLMIKAAATLEIASVAHTKEGVKECRNVVGVDLDSVRSQSSSEDSTEVDDREKLRRMRISNANKGNTPWNKGKKHSPETLRRIKERTRLAMQDPKVKMKLVHLGHAHREETKIKIGVGVRLGWERRRHRLMLQETCHYEWQNLVAGAAQKGLLGEEELQWNSYQVLSEELKKEWLHSVEQRKSTPRPKGSRRAPKSAEQRRKIAEAIAAKWTDPEYRDRVCNGLAKFHGSPEGIERKPKRKPSGDGQPRKRSPKKDMTTFDNENRETKIQIQRARLKRSKTPRYKDPLASSKLEMLKSIREERASAMNKKSVAVARAKLSIAEAEKAAELLEMEAARNNPLAQASLVETRILIAEANRIIESIENEEEPISFENERDLDPENPATIKHRKINGVNSSIVNGSVSMFSNGVVTGSDENLLQVASNGSLPGLKPEPRLENLGGRKKEANLTKKWVRGRLVEVAEENLG